VYANIKSFNNKNNNNHMKTQKQLINNIIGQLEAINRMTEKQEDCQKIIIQMKAVRSALSKVMQNYVQENIARCLSAKGKKINNLELKNLITELINNKK
jgi:CsoR family transcriptional regulator, copper-sensing transcriptional repressor